MASWTALEAVTRENGCLVVVPGSHRGELLPHENPPHIEHLNAAYFGARGVSEAMPLRVHLEMAPGDTVFFHPVLLHGSGRNRTPGFRRAISAHYAALDVTWSWTVEQAGNRRYRIVRGERAGESWQGAAAGGPRVDPLDYLPFRRPAPIDRD